MLCVITWRPTESCCLLKLELVEASGFGYREERDLLSMLRSVDLLLREVSGPLQDRCGPQARVLTAEVHGDEVRGLAFCPGKVLRYVLAARNRRIKTTEMLRLARSSRQPAA